MTQRSRAHRHPPRTPAAPARAPAGSKGIASLGGITTRSRYLALHVRERRERSGDGPAHAPRAERTLYRTTALVDTFAPSPPTHPPRYHEIVGSEDRPASAPQQPRCEVDASMSPMRLAVLLRFGGSDLIARPNATRSDRFSPQTPSAVLLRECTCTCT